MTARKQLAIPAGYDFRVEGQLADPNLMQRLTAYRVLTERRLGNWSGVGAGKTLSAILASRVIDARLTVVVAFNSTVEPWAKRIKETFPDSVVHVKERGEIRVDPRQTHLSRPEFRDLPTTRFGGDGAAAGREASD